MHKPGLIITGKNAGNWYIQTLDGHKNTCRSFDYEILEVDFEPINALLPNKMKAAAALLEPYFAEMENRKQPYILGNITLHEAVKFFSFSPKYFISIEEILQNETNSLRGNVSILGTKYTMNHTYILSLLTNAPVVTLPEKIQNKVDMLRTEYYNCFNKIMAQEVFNALVHLNIDQYLIACTEIAVALEDSNSVLNTIHLPKLQCKYLMKVKKN